MIWFVYGEPRTGKSLFGGLVDAVLPALRNHRHIYTNIPLVPLGICAETGISLFEYKRYVHKLETLQDVLQIYDYENTTIQKEYLNTVWIIDEFRAMKGLTEASEIQFTKILNVAGKNAVDFYLIAQLPTYFDTETRDLGEGCSYFERGDRKGKKNHSIEWLFDKKAGTPTRIGNKWDTEHWRYRYRDPKYFTMYHSYSEMAFMESRGEDHKYLRFYQSPYFKYYVLVALFMLVGLFFLVYLFSNTKSTLNKLTSEKESVSSGLEEIQKIKVDNSDIVNEDNCYQSMWVNDGVVTYKLRSGKYAYNPNYLIERCSRSLTNYQDKNR